MSLFPVAAHFIYRVSRCSLFRREEFGFHLVPQLEIKIVGRSLILNFVWCPNVFNISFDRSVRK
jgi:hypothetical protein